MTEVNKQLGNRRKHHHPSPKAGRIYCDSSYEIKTALILDDDPEVLFYETQIGYVGLHRGRRLDFLVHMKNGTKKMLEIKPKRRLPQFEEQIEDAIHYAASNGYIFEIWSEEELGFANEYQATKWADQYLSTVTPTDFVAVRKDLDRKKAIKHYHKHIATDTVAVWCDYCQETHQPLRLTYDKNIERNGEYICEKKGGFIAGSKPKKKKENPHAINGQKQCTECNAVKAFDEFGLDKSRLDGYSNKCKICRAKQAKDKYQGINNEKSLVTKETNA